MDTENLTRHPFMRLGTIRESEVFRAMLTHTPPSWASPQISRNAGGPSGPRWDRGGGRPVVQLPLGLIRFCSSDPSRVAEGSQPLTFLPLPQEAQCVRNDAAFLLRNRATCASMESCAVSGSPVLEGRCDEISGSSSRVTVPKTFL